MYTDKQYVDAMGLECPNCGSTEITTCGGFDGYGTTSVDRGCECLECGAFWTEFFNLAGYENLTLYDDEGNEIQP